MAYDNTNHDYVSHYDYVSAVADDLTDLAEDNAEDFLGMYDAAGDGADFESRVLDWLADARADITGAEAGGYVFSTRDFLWGADAAETAVTDNLGLLRDALDEGRATPEQVGEWLADGRWEALDSTIRDEVLPRAVHEWSTGDGLRQFLVDNSRPGVVFDAGATPPSPAPDAAPGPGIGI